MIITSTIASTIIITNTITVTTIVFTVITTSTIITIVVPLLYHCCTTTLTNTVTITFTDNITTHPAGVSISTDDRRNVSVIISEKSATLLPERRIN